MFVSASSPAFGWDGRREGGVEGASEVAPRPTIAVEVPSPVPPPRPTPPSVRPARRGGRFLFALLALAAAGGTAWWYLRPVPTAEHAVDDAGDGAEPSLAGGVNEPTVEIDPYANAKAPLGLEEARAGLAAKLSARRLGTLRVLLARGASSPDIAADLEKLFDHDDAAVSLLAKGAAMKVTGDRRFVKEMATSAAEHPTFALPFEILDAVDPVGGRAYVSALLEAKKRRSDPASGTLPGLDQVLAEFENDGKKAVDVLVEAIRSTAGVNDLKPWLGIASALRPIPPALADVLTERLRAGTPDEKTAIAEYLGEPSADFSAATPAFESSIVSMLVKGETTLGFQLVRGLGKFPGLSATSANDLGQYARHGVNEATQVVAIFDAMGPRAADRVGTLLELASSLPPDQVGGLAPVLAKVGGEGVAAFMADRLAKAAPAEVEAWLDGVSAERFPGGSVLIDPLAALARSATEATAAKALAALVRLDPAAASDVARQALASAAADSRPSVRAAAARAAGGLATIPSDLQELLARGTHDADPDVARASREAVAGAWRLGAEGKALLPVLVEISTDGSSPSGATDIAASAIRSLGAIDPLDVRVRRTLVDALLRSSASIEMKRAALAGLAKLTSPSAEERAAVSDLTSDRTLGALARSIVSRSSWKATR